MTRAHLTVAVVALTCGAVLAASCDDDGAVDLGCRESPADCEGQIGGDCEDGGECFEGECCRDKNCGGGMCTFACKDDVDCPEGMACEHSYCFFTCSRDEDCGPGQSCEHKNTICEYEGDDKDDDD